jgi:hypothetical protein
MQRVIAFTFVLAALSRYAHAACPAPTPTCPGCSAAFCDREFNRWTCDNIKPDGATCTDQNQCTFHGTCSGGACIQNDHPTRLAASGVPTTTTAGTASTETVTAQWCSAGTWTTESSYTGTVTVSTTDPQAPAQSYTYRSGDSGSHAFPVALKTAGSQSVTVADNLGTPAPAAQGVSVSPDVLYSLVWTQTMDSPVVAGTTGIKNCNPNNHPYWSGFGTTMQLRDRYGNATTSSDVFELRNTDPQTGLDPVLHRCSAASGSSSVVWGTCDCRGYDFKTAGTQHISVADITNAAIVSPSAQDVVVTPASVSTLQVYREPAWGAGTRTGTPIAPAVVGAKNFVTVSALDAYNNLATNFLGSVSLTSPDDPAFTGSSHQFVAADAGKYRMNFAFGSTGSHTVKASVASSNATGTSPTIQVLPVAVPSFSGNFDTLGTALGSLSQWGSVECGGSEPTCNCAHSATAGTGGPTCYSSLASWNAQPTAANCYGGFPGSCRIQMSTTQVKDGSTSVRIEVDRASTTDGDIWNNGRTITPQECKPNPQTGQLSYVYSNGTQRTELAGRYDSVGDPNRYEEGQEAWFSWSTYLDQLSPPPAICGACTTLDTNGFCSLDANGCACASTNGGSNTCKTDFLNCVQHPYTVLTQWHQEGDCAPSPFGVTLVPDRSVSPATWTLRFGMSDAYLYDPVLGNDSSVNLAWDTSTTPLTGQWHNFLLHVVFSAFADRGVVELYYGNSRSGSLTQQVLNCSPHASTQGSHTKCIQPTLFTYGATVDACTPDPSRTSTVQINYLKQGAYQGLFQRGTTVVYHDAMMQTASWPAPQSCLCTDSAGNHSVCGSTPCASY